MRPVDQGIKRRSGGVQRTQYRDRTGHLARDHLGPTKMVRTDQPIILRELLLEHRNSLGPGTAGVLLLVPSGRADLRQEPLHRGMVAVG